MQEENIPKKEEKDIGIGLDTRSMESFFECAQKPTSKFETDNNLIGFFSLLLQVDKRINPQNYKPQKQRND